MYCIGRARVEGTENWNMHRLAAEFGLPGIAVTRIACALEDAGFLKVSRNDECTLAREPGAIAVQDILSVVRNQKSGDFVARNAPVPAVDALNKRLERAWRAACANETLQDLIAQPAPAPLLVAGDRHVLNEHGTRV
jgi:DNA-binding IscR family transcriptional regulator